MPSPLRNGNSNGNGYGYATPINNHNLFLSTVSQHKIRRLNYLVLLFRLATFSLSVASAVFILSDSSTTSSPRASSLGLLSFRFLFAANAIVAVYSLFQMGAAACEILKGATLLPEFTQLCFDFSHDQIFAYVILAAGVTGAAEAEKLRKAPSCQGDGASFCIQAYISVAFDLGGFLFLALATLASGFRLVCFLATGCRFLM